MLKKEAIQFLRSKGNLLMLFIFPIILITTLSVGLKDMMTNSSIFKEGDETSKVYYTIEDSSPYKEGFLQFKEGVEKNINVKFEEVSSLENVKEDIDNYNAFFHIKVSKDGFNLYSSNKGEKSKVKILRSVFESSLSEYAAYETIEKFNPNAFQNLVRNKYDEYVVKENLNGAREINSSEYYTFAELALIILYVSTIVGESVYNENKLTTINRIRLSKAYDNLLIMSKVTMGVIISILQTTLIYVYSTYVLGVDWSGNLFKFFSLYLVFGLFASIIGALVGLVSKNDSTTSGILQGFIIFVCFLGGCYVPLTSIIASPLMQKLVYLSPIYWINTAISSLLCNMQSNAYTIALLLPLVISVICLFIYFIFINIKGGLAND
ncbi:ABC transporter permease [Clostridium sp. SHJSY1]|uniref:ABC transporter permease n=1 Tax=Clostridium sp. SHJSY1 TaxID=2942483 RepID=UPI00287B7C74|nr:ABC transporter permease [Clostridium sp. SHJSY1]